MTMFKRYQQNGALAEDLSTGERSEAPSAPPISSHTRPHTFGKETVRKDPPPRIFESPTLSAPPPPPEPSYSRASSWNEPVALESEEPETTLGEGVTFKGELSFQRLLRIDGYFEGKLTSTGKLVVGPKGVIKSEELQLREAIIEGKLEGNIKVDDRIELRGDAVVHGNIEAKTLSIDEGVSIIGHVKVTPLQSVEEGLSD